MAKYKVTYYVEGHKKSKIITAINKKDAYFKAGVEDCKIKKAREMK